MKKSKFSEVQIQKLGSLPKDYCSSRIILSDGYKRLFLSYKKNVISENKFNMAKQRLFNTELTKINTNY